MKKSILFLLCSMLLQQSEVYAQCNNLLSSLKTDVGKYRACLREQKGVSEKKLHRLDDYINLSPFVKRRAVALTKDGTYVMIDKRFKVCEKLEYDYVGTIQENGLIIVKKNNKEGYINTKGRVVIPIVYDYVDYFYEGLAKVNKGRLAGYVNDKGENVVPVQYEDIQPFTNGIGGVESKGKHGCVGKEGNKVIPVEYEDVIVFYKGKAMVEKNNTKYVIDRENNVLLTQKYEDVAEPAEGLIGVKRNGKWGFITPQEELIIPYEYDNKFPPKFVEGMCIVDKKGKSGFINNKGEVIIPIKYDILYNFSDGLARFYNYKSDRDGYLNKKGVAFTFDCDRIAENSDFHNGLAAINHNNRRVGWCYINKEGRIVIKTDFDYLGNFYDREFAIVEKGGKWGVINRRGEFVIEPVYESIHNIKHRIICVKKNGKWGYISVDSGEVIIPIEYDLAFSFHNGEVANVIKDRRRYVIDKKGNILKENRRLSRREWRNFMRTDMIVD